MNLVGIWKVKEALTFGEDGGKWLSVQECMDNEEMSDETKSFLSGRFVFEPDGSFKIVMAIPEGVPQEEIDRAAAAGQVRLFDSRSMIVEEHPWKEEDGKYYYDSGIQGEVLGEPVSSWMEIQETEDGIEWMIYRLVKAEEL